MALDKASQKIHLPLNSPTIDAEDACIPSPTKPYIITLAEFQEIRHLPSETATYGTVSPQTLAPSIIAQSLISKAN